MNYYDEVIDIYESHLGIPFNGHCQSCDASNKSPLLPWQIGTKYNSDAGRVFIAGKPHRGTPGDVLDSNIIDGREVAERLFFTENWPYWNYTKEALNIVYGSDKESWEHIAFTNIVKCTSTNDTDNTSWACAEKCIVQNKVIIKEIELLKPRKIIFFTWSMYRDLFEAIPFAVSNTIVEHTDSEHRVPCGAKQLGWWEPVSLLIVGHPERMKKVEYVIAIAQWLTKP
ncbi:hypothetical protein [Vibrio scophthalmi]|uniref:Uracil-DNA glycosylase-like domain-containing protein n=1 Tax=Vibrio scophthalmi LMG 19158 TaxID=870967 RepID=F9RJ01_9VIBR|nr:hypothetical protein [Vibrio scophthalmi]EGU41586.1 hypothetical protein VIS19158_07460 [Vibrio scophthalmi LMG 19158]